MKLTDVIKAVIRVSDGVHLDTCFTNVDNLDFTYINLHSNDSRIYDITPIAGGVVFVENFSDELAHLAWYSDDYVLFELEDGKLYKLTSIGMDYHDDEKITLRFFEAVFDDSPVIDTIAVSNTNVSV